ncbi:MAG: hypothetical protein AAGN64_09895 [Bacteroidota bacterium]
MHRPAFFALLVLGLVTASPAIAQTSADNATAVRSIVQDLLVRSNSYAAVTAFETMVQQNPDSIAQDMRAGFDRDAFTETLERTIADSLTLAQAEALLTWMEQPAIRRAQQADLLYLSDPDADAKLDAFGQQLGTAIPLDTTRAQLAYLMEEATQAGELILDMIVATTQALTEGATMTAEEEAEVRAMLGPQMADYSVLSNYYIYRDLSIEEMAGYARALNSEEGALYYEVIGEGFGAAMREWAEGTRAAMEARLTDEFEEPRSGKSAQDAPDDRE